jgi:chaperonin cofactor prefoldin
LPRILVEMAKERIAEMQADIASLEADMIKYEDGASILTRLMKDRDTLRAQIKEIEDAIRG